MKKFMTFIAVLLICMGLAVPALAANGDLVVDDANLLTASEEQSLESTLEQIRSTYGYDVVVHTTDNIDGSSIMTYADDYYDQNGFAADSVIFVVNMDTENGGEGRGWWISSAGKGINALTDYGISYIGSESAAYLKQGDFAAAFETYADLSQQFIEEYEQTGTAYDTNKHYSEPEEPRKINWLMAIVVGLVIGVVMGLIISQAQKAKHKSVRRAQNAGNYIVPGTLKITGSSDNYLYSNVVAAPIPQNNNQGGRPGGGSSVHVSGGGVSHGGGGGRF